MVLLLSVIVLYCNVLSCIFSAPLTTTNCFRRCIQKTVEDLGPICIVVHLIANFRLPVLLVYFLVFYCCNAQQASVS